ncbi:MAG: Type 1 glutamine amidotransferase-like domain-containing protein [Gemmatimonadaceae bacterium]
MRFVVASACLASGLASARIPVVASQVGPIRGTLVLDGGPEASAALGRRFVELAGGANARIVVVPTAMGDDAHDPATLAHYQRLFGDNCCTLLDAADRVEADRAAFASPLATATGVWISGGSPARVADIYWRTTTSRAIRAVLERGGVVGGSSAGAVVLGARVPTTQPDRGFAFLTNVIVMAHANRGRAREMLVSEAAASGMIGVGIPEGTAVIIRRDSVEVVGPGEVIVASGSNSGAEDYRILREGEHMRLEHQKAANHTPPRH